MIPNANKTQHVCSALAAKSNGSRNKYLNFDAAKDVSTNGNKDKSPKAIGQTYVTVVAIHPVEFIIHRGKSNTTKQEINPRLLCSFLPKIISIIMAINTNIKESTMRHNHMLHFENKTIELSITSLELHVRKCTLRNSTYILSSNSCKYLISSAHLSENAWQISNMTKRTI